MPGDPPVATSWVEYEPGQRLALDRLAGRQPGYLYLHGRTATRKAVKSQLLRRHAADRGRAMAAFDFRGCGDSDGDLARATLTDMIADTRRVLDQLGPSVLVGSSMGGLVAAWTAARHPELVAGLTLIAPALGILPAMVARGAAPGWSAALVTDAAGYDEATLGPRLVGPVLIVHGELDDIVPCQGSRALWESIRHDDKELWIVPGGDHLLHGTMPEICHRTDRLIGL